MDHRCFDWCGRRQMIGWNGALADRELNRIASAFIKRQQTHSGIAAQLSISDVQKNVESDLGGPRERPKEVAFFFRDASFDSRVRPFWSAIAVCCGPVYSLSYKKARRANFQWTQLLDDASVFVVSGRILHSVSPTSCYSWSKLLRLFIFRYKTWQEVLGD